MLPHVRMNGTDIAPNNASGIQTTTPISVAYTTRNNNPFTGGSCTGQSGEGVVGGIKPMNARLPVTAGAVYYLFYFSPDKTVNSSQCGKSQFSTALSYINMLIYGPTHNGKQLKMAKSVSCSTLQTAAGYTFTPPGQSSQPMTLYYNAVALVPAN